MEVRTQIISHLADWLEHVHSTEALYNGLKDIIPEDRVAEFRAATQFLIFIEQTTATTTEEVVVEETEETEVTEEEPEEPVPEPVEEEHPDVEAWLVSLVQTVESAVSEIEQSGEGVAIGVATYLAGTSYFLSDLSNFVTENSGKFVATPEEIQDIKDLLDVSSAQIASLLDPSTWESLNEEFFTAGYAHLNLIH